MSPAGDSYKENEKWLKDCVHMQSKSAPTAMRTVGVALDQTAKSEGERW